MKVWNYDELGWKPCFAVDMAAELSAVGPVAYLVRSFDGRLRASTIEQRPDGWKFMDGGMNLT